MNKKRMVIALSFLLIISIALNISLYCDLNNYRRLQNETDLHFKGSISSLSAILSGSEINSLEQISIPISEKTYALACYSSYKSNDALMKALSKLDFVFKNKSAEGISKHKFEIVKFLEDIIENPSDKNASEGLLNVLNKIDNNQ
jgi:hypothetical protein